MTTLKEAYLAEMPKPSKKLQEFAKKYNLSWKELDSIIMQCEPDELDTLNTGDPKEIRKILTKYHS